jgi:hypothetical protein
MLQTDYITCAIDGRFQGKLLHYWARELTKFGHEWRAMLSCPLSQLDFGQFSLLGNGRFAGISNAGGNFRTVPGASGTH